MMREHKVGDSGTRLDCAARSHEEKRALRLAMIIHSGHWKRGLSTYETLLYLHIGYSKIKLKHVAGERQKVKER
jgi:hypothetical protein